MRIGRFEVSQSLLESNELPEFLAWLRFVPLRAEYMYHRGVMEYHGLSPKFDEVNYGASAPTYSISVSMDTDSGQLTFSVEKC